MDAGMPSRQGSGFPRLHTSANHSCAITRGPSTVGSPYWSRAGLRRSPALGSTPISLTYFQKRSSVHQSTHLGQSEFEARPFSKHRSDGNEPTGLTHGALDLCKT